MKKSWHSPRYVKARRRRLALRGALYALSAVITIQFASHDAWLYGGDKGGSDPVSLVILVALIVVSTFATSEVK